MHIVPSEAKLGVFHQEIGWLDVEGKEAAYVIGFLRLGGRHLMERVRTRTRGTSSRLCSVKLTSSSDIAH